MYNLSSYITSLASNPYDRIIEKYGISIEKQVTWALEWAEKKIVDADKNSCRGLARIDIGSAASALCKADSVQNTTEHTEMIRKLDSLLRDVCLKWGI